MTRIKGSRGADPGPPGAAKLTFDPVLARAAAVCSVHALPHSGKGRTATVDLDIILWIIAVLLIIGGLAGTVFPALPGVPIVFAGLLLAAWATDFTPVGAGTLALLGVLTAVAWLVDFLAAAVGARRLGASPRAFWGATFGAIVGIFFGFVGIILGPFVGAVVGELSGGRPMAEAGRAGMGAWIGTVVGAALKIAIAFLMVGIFVLAQFFD